MEPGCEAEPPPSSLSHSRLPAPAGLAAVVAVAVVLVTLAGASGCASRPAPRHFLAAGEEQAAQALAAWKSAVARSGTMGPSRLLYDAKIRQGLGSISGTLAIESSTPVRGQLSGPFGSILAVYADGVLRGDKVPPIALAPEPLLWLLAGVWQSGIPRVEGIDIEADDALLVWSGSSPARGVIRMSDARFSSIRADRAEGPIEAAYEGVADPWPEKITLTDARSGNTLRLVLQAKEPLP